MNSSSQEKLQSDENSSEASPPPKLQWSLDLMLLLPAYVLLVMLMDRALRSQPCSSVDGAFLDAGIVAFVGGNLGAYLLAGRSSLQNLRLFPWGCTIVGISAVLAVPIGLLSISGVEERIKGLHSPPEQIGMHVLINFALFVFSWTIVLSSALVCFFAGIARMFRTVKSKNETSSASAQCQ